MDDYFERYMVALRDGDWRARQSLVDALGKIGDPSGVPVLVQALRDGNDSVRATAVGAIVKLGLRAIPDLIEALKDSNWYVREAAAEALGRIGDPSVVPALIQAITHEDWYVPQRAEKSLWNTDLRALPEHFRRIRDNYNPAGTAAGDALGKIGLSMSDSDAVPALAGALAGSQATRQAAGDALVRIGPRAVRALTEALAEPAMRPSVAGVLERIAAEAPTPALISALPALNQWERHGPAEERQMYERVRMRIERVTNSLPPVPIVADGTLSGSPNVPVVDSLASAPVPAEAASSLVGTAEARPSLLARLWRGLGA